MRPTRKIKIDRTVPVAVPPVGVKAHVEALRDTVRRKGDPPPSFWIRYKDGLNRQVFARAKELGVRVTVRQERAKGQAGVEDGTLGYRVHRLDEDNLPVCFYVSAGGGSGYHVAIGTAKEMHEGGTHKALCGVRVTVEGYAMVDGKAKVAPVCRACAQSKAYRVHRLDAGEEV